jgi:hypothetical protein
VNKDRNGLLGMYIICAIIGAAVGAVCGSWVMGGIIGLCVAGGIHLAMFLIAVLFIHMIIGFFDSVSGRRHD